MADPFGRAVHDRWRDEQSEPLVQREGSTAREHATEMYLGEFAAESEDGQWLESRLDGPLLDMGAGAGRLALCFQERFETVAIEASEHLVETMDERGVRNARHVDMFALREAFGRDRFRSALAIGTQAGLAGSMGGLRQFLGDLAAVTTPDAIAVFECYDPERERTAELLGYRADPTPGLASRTMHFEYGEVVGETLLFRLFSPDRLREAAVGTGWTVVDVRRSPGEHPCPYTATLETSS
ncbi:SAM-dependent methyltransferase [Halobacteriales archaeon QS_4_69_34]|nr:MAG: SAM-dependent methyltransferase [Halobacteriales archaeon QS_4_69_34]